MILDHIYHDLKQLVGKYRDTHSSEEVLQRLHRIIDLELATSLLHARLDQNIYEVFEKDENNIELINKGKLIKDNCRVIYVHKAKTCQQYYNEVIIEFSFTEQVNKCRIDLHKASNSKDESKTSIQGVNNNLISDTAHTNSHKRKSEEMRKGSLQQLKHHSIAPPTLFKLKYIFNEHSVDSNISATNRDDLGKSSVMEYPAKSINLTISISHGAASLDEMVVIDFQMLTASFSPSAQRILINQHPEKEEEEDSTVHSYPNSNQIVRDDNTENNVSKKSMSSIPIDDRIEDVEEAHDVEDIADYYSVDVNIGAIEKLSKWLQFEQVPQPPSLCMEDNKSKKTTVTSTTPSKMPKKCEDEYAVQTTMITGTNGNNKIPGGARSSSTMLCTEDDDDDRVRRIESTSTEEIEDDQDDDDECGHHSAYYAANPSSRLTLLFLLSLPYVDEAWGIHDLILDHELGNEDADSEYFSD